MTSILKCLCQTYNEMRKTKLTMQSIVDYIALTVDKGTLQETVSRI
jgi:hypothetical protein